LLDAGSGASPRVGALAAAAAAAAAAASLN